MLTLDEHNQQYVDKVKSTKCAGVKCPRCNQEMDYFGTVFPTTPMQVAVICNKCGYYGSKIESSIGTVAYYEL